MKNKINTKRSGDVVIHFTGHRISSPSISTGFLSKREQPVAEEIADVVSKFRIMAAYGSLAAGADILFAEALLARRVPLYVTLPFELQAFTEASVRPSGEVWVARLQHALAAAVSVEVLVGDPARDESYAACAHACMDHAIATARQCSVAAMQFAVWDGIARDQVAGTCADVAEWRGRGMPSIIISPLNSAEIRSEPGAVV